MDDEVPFDDRHVPRAEIEWERSAWWWRPITRAIHPARKLLSLILGAVGVWLTAAGVLLADWLFAPRWDGLRREIIPEPEPFKSLAFAWIANIAEAIGSFDTFGIREFAFATFTGLWLATVFAFIGGLLSRRALVELGQQTIAPWGESLRLACSRWASFLWCTGMHFVGIAILLIPAVLFGMLGRTGNVGAAIGGVLLVATFLLIFAVGRLALSMFLSFPLSTCAIVAEKNADAFEGFSRANAYLFQRPAVAVFVSVALFIVGLIGEQVVYWTVTLGWSFTLTAFTVGGGGQIPESAQTYVGISEWLATALICAYWFSYFWAASAALYLILRKSVDYTEFDALDTSIHPIEKTLPEIPTSPPTGQEPQSVGTSSGTSDVASDPSRTQAERSQSESDAGKEVGRAAETPPES